MDLSKYPLEELGRRAHEDPRLRHFPWLGWSVVLVPLDVIPSRSVAAFMIGTMYGFEPEELFDLRSRRFEFDDEPIRTWWVFAIPKSASDRRAKPVGDPE